jgi:hypothetical protein
MSDFKKLLDIIEENSNDDPIELHDSFDLELDNGYVIETGIVGFTNDGIIIEGDEITCNLLGLSGILLEDIDSSEYNDEAGMADNNLETLRRAVDGIDELIQPGDNLPEWCQEKIAIAKSSLVAVWDYMRSEKDRGAIDEAEYQGRNVALGKPMQGDVKKSKVYVRKPNGKVVKVNFGDKKMRIKKSNPGRRKNFRARHNCENPGPRWKARYWSCRAW